MQNLSNFSITVIGLGYVGLPLAVSLAKYFKIYGLDVSRKKIESLRKGDDKLNLFKKNQLSNLKNIQFVSDYKYVKKSKLIIICLPTPVNKKNKPNLSLIFSSAKQIAKNLKKGSTIVLESTVYPSFTEKEFIPYIEKYSQLKHMREFFVGYSPERINPGDKINNLQTITKIISGDSVNTLKFLNNVYKKVCKKLHKVDSIKVAESAKIIENTQRDVNIALINEFSKILHKINVNSNDVLKAAATKWNFLNFKPGLVGGHCIGVDPYYLSYLAEKINLNPEVVLAGRKINNSMVDFVQKSINKLLKIRKISKAKILFMGLSFKENCNDIRNSKNLELFYKLNKKHHVEIFDPLIDLTILKKKYKIYKLSKKINFDCIVIAVNHNEFKKIKISKFKKIIKKNGFIVDLMNYFNTKKHNENYIKNEIWKL
tara:strand:+ start:609 stop:1892 length:1284 start_codon:yes stop_codon:yes gene_type:complete